MTLDEAVQRLKSLGLLVSFDEDEIFADERTPPAADGIAVSKPVARIVRKQSSWMVISKLSSTVFSSLASAIESVARRREIQTRIIRPPRRDRPAIFADFAVDVDVLAYPTLPPHGDRDVFVSTTS